MEDEPTVNFRSFGKSRRSVGRALVSTLLATLTLPASAAIAPPTPVPDASGYIVPTVSTIAGNGKLGIENGSALSASFMEPSGIAVSDDGTIYVADASAQNVRQIKRGIVTTLAGLSLAGGTIQGRPSGYVDGPANVARFNRPMGLAVARDGAIYVADLGNHCIRRIKGGFVTTFAGSEVAGEANGAGKQAQFQHPLSVAVDDDNNVYVADYDVGLRKISPDGAVTTLDVPLGENKKVFGVAARGSGASLQLAWTANRYIFLRNGSTLMNADGLNVREPTSEGLNVGQGDSIAIVGASSVVVTDLVTNCVRFLQFSVGRFDVAAMTRSLAGGIREGDAVMSGYRDGPSTSALVDVPLGVARAADGSLLISDAGNRRIRKISVFDTRGPLLDDLSNLVGPKDTYKIVVVGNSFTFNNVLWGESIPGILESALNRDAKLVAMKRRVSVTAVRLDATDVTLQRQFIEEYLGDGEADLVVLLVNAFSHNTELMARPEIAAGSWKTLIPQELRETQARAQSNGTKMMIVVLPEGQTVSPVEVTARDLFDSALEKSEVQSEGRLTSAMEIEHVYISSGLKALPLTAAFLNAESAPDRRSFYNTNDIHLTVNGSIFVGRKLAEFVEAWRPWTR